MEGTKLKYRTYEKTGTGYLYIPKALGEALKWKSGTTILASVEVIEGKKGLFLVPEPER